MRLPAFSQWAISLPCRAVSSGPSPSPASVIASGMLTIVISSIAARPPRPRRPATSPPSSRGVEPPTRTTQQRLPPFWKNP
jgi:hypothetical protein